MIFDTEIKKLEETLNYLDNVLVAIKHHAVALTEELLCSGMDSEEMRRGKALAMQKEMQDFRKNAAQFYNALRAYYSTPTPLLVVD